MTQESIGSTPPQRPSIGRIVHWTTSDDFDIARYGTARAAIITGIRMGNKVTLRVLLPSGGDIIVDNARFADAPTAGCWSWPERT